MGVDSPEWKYTILTCSKMLSPRSDITSTLAAVVGTLSDGCKQSRA